MRDSTKRFSDRVRDYVRHRPTYPGEVIELLESECGLGPGSVVADVGSGTGIFTELLLEAGCEVRAVEPNEAMRRAAEERLGGRERFRSVAATAEATGLEGGSLAGVTAAQAFHWFDPEPTRREFARILRPDGWVALIWNERRTDSTSFLREYEELLRRHGTDYTAVDHKRTHVEALETFLGGTEFQRWTGYNEQWLDRQGLEGRLLSSSYAPRVGQPGHEAMLRDLAELFDRHADRGRIRIEYDTIVYYGGL